MIRILKYIDCCVILHNLLISLDRGEVGDKTWIDSDDTSDIDGASRAPRLTDNINRPMPPNCCGDERRRRLQTYFELKEYCQH